MVGQGALAAGLRVRGQEVLDRTAELSRLVSLVALVVMFAAVTVLRWFFDGAGQAVALLYVLPITFGAFRFRRRGGIVTAGFAAAAFAVLAVVHEHGDLDLTGWAGPLLSMGLVGYLADLAAHRESLVRAQAERNRHLSEAQDAQRAALAANDSFVQQVAAARWMLEAGRTEQAIGVLGESVAESIAHLSPGLAACDREPPAEPTPGSVPAAGTDVGDPGRSPVA